MMIKLLLEEEMMGQLKLFQFLKKTLLNLLKIHFFVVQYVLLKIKN